MKNEIAKHVDAAKSYINTHPDTTGTVNAMIALTSSIQQIENQTKKLNKNIDTFNQTSSRLSAQLVWWTGILAVATIALVITNIW